MADESNYHILLWPEPPGPPLYQCLLCPLTNVTDAAILAHLPEAHETPPRPTPMAAEPPLIDAAGAVTFLTPEGRRMADTPTYYLTQEADGTETFHCLYCETAGQEHHATDPGLFAQHMAQRHDGRMQMTADGRKPEPPHEEPPGQTGDHPDPPDHPHEGPPGHTGEPPEGEEPQPEPPIVEPDKEGA